jgi:hypothetical protein
MISSIKGLFLAVFSFAILFSANAAFARDVEVHVHNPCRSKGQQCFQLDIYLDGALAKSCVTSPGNPAAGSKSFPGSNTPEYVRARFTSINGPGYHSHRGDAMPYAMHINSSGYAVHGSSLTVNGKKASHGCMRVKNECAKALNGWMKEARNSGGLMEITVEDTKARY